MSAQNGFKVKKGILHLTPVDSLPSNPSLGDIVLLSTDSFMYRWDGAEWQQFIDESSPQTLSNKTFDGASITVDSMYGTLETDSTTTGSLATLPLVQSYILKVSNSGLTSISGITAPSPTGNQFFVLTNDLSTAIDVLNDDAGASAANRILTGTGSKLKLAANASLWLYYDSTSDLKWRVVGGSGSGSGQGVTKVRLHSATLTSLPTGTGLIIDGQTVQAGDLVLFTALSSNNNRIYLANGTGTTITSWTAQDLFSGLITPASGDLVIVQEGAGFAARTGAYNGSSWSFNSTVRYFNGPDYWEQSALNTVTLANNQVSAADIFSVGATGSENIEISYSIQRGTTKATGIFFITHNGSVVGTAQSGAGINSTGITLSADLSGGNVRLRYTSTNSGSTATFKFSVKRWSDSAGGPGNLASYSVGSSDISGSGASGQITLWNGTSSVEGTESFKYNTLTGSLTTGTGASLLERTQLTSATLPDNTSGTLVFQVATSEAQFFVIEFSVVRNTDRTVGHLYLTTNGTTASVAPAITEIGTPGVSFTADVSGGNVRLLANTSNTGQPATMKFSMKKWK